jgi:hypothetical protein
MTRAEYNKKRGISAPAKKDETRKCDKCGGSGVLDAAKIETGGSDKSDADENDTPEDKSETETLDRCETEKDDAPADETKKSKRDKADKAGKAKRDKPDDEAVKPEGPDDEAGEEDL